MSFFNIKFNLNNFVDKVKSTISSWRDSIVGYIAGDNKGRTSPQYSQSKVEDLFKTGVLEAVAESRINYTKRVQDIVDAFRIQISDYGTRGTQQFTVSHDFLKGQDPKWYTRVRKKTYTSKGSVVLKSLQYGRKQYDIFPKSEQYQLMWGYPYPREKRMAQMVTVRRKGIYRKGIGMIERGTKKVREYFAGLGIKLRKGVSSL
jgi:hypothetical protein